MAMVAGCSVQCKTLCNPAATKNGFPCAAGVPAATSRSSRGTTASATWLSAAAESLAHGKDVLRGPALQKPGAAGSYGVRLAPAEVLIEGRWEVGVMDLAGARDKVAVVFEVLREGHDPEVYSALAVVPCKGAVVRAYVYAHTHTHTHTHTHSQRQADSQTDT